MQHERFFQNCYREMLQSFLTMRLTEYQGEQFIPEAVFPRRESRLLTAYSEFSDTDDLATLPFSAIRRFPKGALNRSGVAPI